MGQYFLLYNLDNSANVCNSVDGKFGEYYFMAMDTGPQLMKSLWSPDEKEKRVLVRPLNQAKGLSFPQESNQKSSEGLLNQLSNEVVDIIIGNLLDISDVLGLMLTCQRYWESGRCHLERLIEDSILVSWAGDRLICMGDYARIDDLPEGMLTDSEFKRLRRSYDETEDLDDAIRIFQKPHYNMSSRVRGSISSTRDIWKAVDPRIWALLARRNLVDSLILITDLDPHDFFNGYMVLRNLTTKEYVRGDAVAKLWDMPDKPWLRKITFEHVLYIRTTWSSDPSLSTCYDGPLEIHRGVWAGHRFDVKRIESVADEEGVAVDCWKDVTKEVIDEVIEVWEEEGR